MDGAGSAEALAAEEDPKLEYPPGSTSGTVGNANYAQPSAPLVPRPPSHVPLPWEPVEDLILVGVVHRETLPSDEARTPPTQVAPLSGAPDPSFPFFFFFWSWWRSVLLFVASLAC